MSKISKFESDRSGAKQSVAAPENKSRKLSPRNLLAAGLLTFTLAAAGCESDYTEPHQSKETKAKITQTLKASAQKAAVWALKMSKNNPEAAITYGGPNQTTVHIETDDTTKIATVGTFRDQATFHVSMKNKPGTNQPDPSQVEYLDSGYTSTVYSQNGDTTVHSSSVSIFAPDGSKGTWHAIYGGTESKNGDILRDLTVGQDTRYQSGNPAVEAAKGAAHQLAYEVSQIQNQLKHQP